MADEFSRSSVPARTSLNRLLPIEPDGGVAEDRALTVVVINVPMAVRPARTPALRPIGLVTQRMPAVSQFTLQKLGLLAVLPPALLLIAGSALNWWHLPRNAPDEPVNAIRIMLPAPQIDVPLQPASDLASASRNPAVLLPDPSTYLPSRKQTGILRSTAPVSGGANSKLAEIGDLPEVAAATRLALRSGVAQRWQATGISGVVVAGPAQIDDSNVCRTVAVLADGGAGGQTVRSVLCMTRAGKWVSRTPVTAKDTPTLAAPVQSDVGPTDPVGNGTTH